VAALVVVDLTAPAITPAALMDIGRRQERFAAVSVSASAPHKKNAEDGTVSSQCVR